MPTNVVMPQMGESITEGTVVRWIKKVGDVVDRDEPLFEISSDKVDAEIPSPAAGVLLDIRVREGETVPVDTVVALLGEAGEIAPPSSEPSVAAPAPDGVSTPSEDAAAVQVAEAAPAAVATAEDLTEARRRQKSSPLVRRIAAEHQVDISRVAGTGISGRVTKSDILQFIEGRPGGAAAPSLPPVTMHIPAFQPGDDVVIEPLSVMRKKIAEHMLVSRRTSAHVHTMFEVDYTRVAAARQALRADAERAGVKLTYLAFIAKAVADALAAVPVLNASLDGDNVVYKKDVNLGFAVALDWGLVVPVVHRAGTKDVIAIAAGIADVAARARAKQLRGEDVQGGTFTITNPGSFGSIMGTPIINQPQVAILAVGAIEKRVAVIDDMIAIRQRGYLTLGFDHRLVDGAVADAFMSRVKAGLEHWS